MTEKSTEALLEERRATHGEYRDHTRCTQAILLMLQRERNWEKLDDIMKESLHMFAHKMARIATGNPDTKDHWDDIAGYAVLVSQRLATPDKFPAFDVYSKLAAAWGVTRAEAKIESMKMMYGEGLVDRQGTPEDGAHHSRQPSTLLSDFSDDELRTELMYREKIKTIERHGSPAAKQVLEQFRGGGNVTKNDRGDGNQS
jgi:hypothetical protein